MNKIKMIAFDSIGIICLNTILYFNEWINLKVMIVSTIISILIIILFSYLLDKKNTEEICQKLNVTNKEEKYYEQLFSTWQTLGFDIQQLL